VKQSRIFAVVFAGALAASGAERSAAQVTANAAVGWGWGWPSYGVVVPVRCGPSSLGWAGPWGACGAGVWVDDPWVRRAIQRELAQYEHLREIEERAQRNIQSYGVPLQGPRGDWPPPTPESQVQPAFRGSGEIRPEFSGAGQFRQDAAGAPR
jgi:hypothetical protein